MKRQFIDFVKYLFFLEFAFHFACFRSVDLPSTLFILFVSVISGGFLTFICSFFKNEKVGKIIGRVIFTILAVLFSAELVYYSIYESFFSFNGVKFAGALVGGYDKVIKTIIQNIFYVILFLIPAILSFVEFPKSKRNKVDFALILLFMIVCTSYLGVSIQFIGKNKEDSLYNLVHYKNMPILNVKKMGLVASASLNIKKKLTGFKPVVIQDEDILSNKKSFLIDQEETEYNVDSSINFRELIDK